MSMARAAAVAATRRGAPTDRMFQMEAGSLTGINACSSCSMAVLRHLTVLVPLSARRAAGGVCLNGSPLPPQIAPPLLLDLA